MKARHRALARIAIVASVPWMLFTACAEGSKIEQSSTSSGTGGEGGGTGIPPGQIGGACEAQEDCQEGNCTQVGADKYCTIACPPACPAGTYCGIIQGDSLCVPDLGQQCLTCNAPVDCKSPSDACLTAPPGDKFCAIDCTTMGQCPNGFTCMDADVYLNGGATGTGTGSGGGGGAGGGAGGAGGGAAGGPPHPSGVPYKFCVPSNAQSCPCNAKREGVTHTCYKENAFGKCGGTETCQQGSWQGCSADSPAAEQCNGQDDNCNDQIDDGDPVDLCGPLPPHATWVCNAAKCEVGMCEPGWTAYPPGPPEDGCTCQQELGEPNGTCGAAAGAGSVSDTGGSITFSGTISSAQDVDFWQLDTVDTAEASTNSYHISIDFTAPMPNDEFLFDVIRGDNCVAVPSGPGAGITSYDWCVDGISAAGDEGEAGCGPMAGVHCNNNSSKYYVRVYRKPGATGTCTQYTVTVTASGGDACDFTQKCP